MENNKELQELLHQTKSGKQLSEYHIKLLKKQNINTPQEFVIAENIHKFLAISAENIDQIKRELLSFLVVRVKLKNLYQHNPLNYTTGIDGLDKLLDSVGQPLRPGRIWELYGVTGVGKTRLLHTLAANFVCQYRDNQQVLFIDTKHDFDSEHLSEILLEKQLDHAAIESCLERILVEETPTAECLIETLEDMLTKLAANDESVSQIKLVLVDSLAVLFILFRTSNEINNARSLLNKIAMLVRKLASRYGIAFVLGNLSFFRLKESDDDCDDWFTQSSVDGQDDCSLLGEYWSSVCTLALALELLEDSDNSDNIRLLKVLKNSYGVSESSCLLNITDAGVI